MAGTAGRVSEGKGRCEAAAPANDDGHSGHGLTGAEEQGPAVAHHAHHIHTALAASAEGCHVGNLIAVGRGVHRDDGRRIGHEVHAVQ